ncbi:MAG: CDP-diacylglycerol--glycerol-3-phosphate 3-phosphatidyltransferase [Xylanivirga thermophila]|jgi:CDP-diacylglycerol---glycerol-3-phosphate 3-phosphatidyltransferase|uniref:CDP-diacylglycerol--glycerol-3-phosphate 3-phosphatidyltransferase n=1 Tax=Xylanivirga thermophila TaxID=2496273 RepID=UPI00101D580F|nr:CDP-diacylglycerol--glycerol-3-phosphate 3-phosphatidyltransferase [Xylanivirga thermophila]
MNLANKITMIRICLIPIFLICLWSSFPFHQSVAAVIFILAAASDGLDGYIARSRNQITNFGKFVDPLADKLLITAALVALCEMGKVPALAVIIILSREFIITGFRTLAASEGVVIAASWWGKSKTVSQIIAIVAILLDNVPFKWIGVPFDKIALYVSVVLTIISGIDYIYKNKHLILQNR